MIQKCISLILVLVLLCGMLPQTVFLASAEETEHIHSYEPAVTSPTCAEQGYTTYTCACGDSYVDAYVNATGEHTWSSWVEVTAPTCAAEGKDQRSCAACGEKQERDTRITGDSNKILVSNPVGNDYFAGKNLLLIGDSITCGVGVSDRITEVYGQIVGQKLSMAVTNKGVSGSGYCSGGAMATNKTLTEANVRNADVVTIMLGVNDWNWAVKDGSWNGKAEYYDKSQTYYQLGDFNSTDTSTLYGALHSWCQNIVAMKQKAEFEDKEFVVITPLISSWNISVGKKDWNQDKENIHGHTFREHCTAIMEVCAYYEIPVFDANMFSGIYYKSAENNNVAETGGDGVHVNAAGHALLADALEEFLLEGYTYESRVVAEGGHTYENGVCWSCRLPFVCKHSYSVVVTSPTCTEKGYTTHTCACGASFVDSYVEAKGHSYENDICTGCGIKDYRDVTYVAFGDSITYGVDGNYRDGPERVMSNPYPKLVGQHLGFGTVLNKAVSGGTLCADSGHTNMTEKILAFHGEADVISVMLGVNDYQVRCPMGEIDSTDNKTIYGSLNLVCQHLKENYPDAFVFFMTPFQYRGGEKDRGAGYNLPAIAEAIKTVAAKYDIPVLDMYTYGRYEEEFNDTSLVYQDGIHPSQQHHIKYTAPMIAEFIGENYDGPKEEDSEATEGKIIYTRQNLTKGYCTVSGTVAASSVHSYFTMDAAGIESITITPPEAPAWNPNNIYYIVIVEEDGKVSCYGKLNKQEPTVIELGGKVKGTVYFNAFYDDHPQYVYVKEAVVVPHEHAYETAITAPTCTEQGYTTYTCDCGDSYVNEHTDAAGHNYDRIVCTVCGKKYPDEITELGSTLAVTMTPENYLTISNPFTEKLACGPGLAAYGDGSFAVAYLADDTNTVETESSATIVCRLGLFDMDAPENGTFFDIAAAGQTIGSVTIGSKAPYEPNLLKLSNDALLVLFNIRDAAGNYVYYSARFDTVSKTVTSYQPLTLDGKSWTPTNIAASYNALVENDISSSGPAGSMVFTSKIIQHEGYYYGYCGGICSGFSGILVRSTDGINWTSVMVPEALSEMAGVIECGFQFINDYVYFCMRDISSGVYHCSYNFDSGKQLSKTVKIPGLTTSKPAAFIQDGNLYVIVNKATGDDNTVGRRNTALFYQVEPETCRLTLRRQVFCADGVAYHSIDNINGTNYWSFHTDARRINPYSQGRSNLALRELPELYAAEGGRTDGVLDLNDYDYMFAKGCITVASNTWQAGAVNMHYQIPLADFADFDTVTITASSEQKAYIAFFTDRMTQTGTISYAEGWTEQLIMEPGTIKTLAIPADAAYLYILNNNAAGANLLPESVVFSKTEVEQHTHTYTSVVTAPTCTEQGYTTYTCECGNSYVDSYVDAAGHTYEKGICCKCGSAVSPYLQQLPDNITGCSNLYDILTPTKGYYTATKYDTSNGAVLSVVIPVEPGDRIAASSFGPVSENMGSVNGIRVTYLLGDEIVTSLSAGDVYNGYTKNGYITVPEGVDAVCIPWWAPSDSNWLTLGQISKNFASHSPKTVSAQAPTCTENGYTAGEICEICGASLGSREEIPATGHDYSGNTCTVCGTVNILAILDGKYVSILGDSISTFNGYSNDATVNTTIGGNGPRYNAGTADTKPGSYCLLESVDDTWWMHFANRSGMKLLVNNSWAGSQVFGGQTSDGRVIPAAYLERCVNLHDNTVENNPNNAPINPDVIFVYLGINDYNFNRSNVGNGAVDYAALINSDGTYVTPATFGEAYGILLHKMQQAYPDAQIFAMTLLPENLYSVDMTAWEQHNAYIRAAAEYYDVPLVDLAENCAITWENYSGYMIDKIHPTTAGMKLISDCIEAELVAYYTENPPHTHSYTTTVTAPTCTEKGYTTYTCACGDSYVADFVDATGEHTYDGGICTGCGDNPYAGKTLVCIGDSITYGVGANGNPYHKILGEDLGMNVTNLGASGWVMCTGGHRNCRINVLTEENCKGKDVVTIFLGINDWANAVKDGYFGGKLTYEPGKSYYALGELGSDDTSTIYGAMKMWCEKIVELRQLEGCKNTEFYFITPVITSWNNSVTGAKNWDQSKTNIHGYTLRDLCNAIIEVCGQYDVPVIDLNLVSGMYYNSPEDNNVAVFGGDGVHPGEVGHQMMAETIKDALLQNHQRDDHTHSYGSWITTTYPGCEAGEQQRVCSICTAVEKRTVEGTGHTYQATVTPPTCTEQGYTTYTCVCGESFVDTYTEPLGHTPGEPVKENETKTGYDAVVYCEICGTELSREQVVLYIPGDINGDGAVNNKDATRLFQYMTGWRVEVAEAALDVNGDGKVNNKDATRLFQYLSGWPVEIY